MPSTTSTTTTTPSSSFPTPSKPTSLLLPPSLPSPLPANVRNATLSSLLSSKTIPELQRVLRAECTEAGWFDAMRARAKQLIREQRRETKNGRFDEKRVRETLVREALKGRKRSRSGGGEGEEWEWEDDGMGMMRKKVKVRYEDYGDEDEDEDGREEEEKVDVRVPETAVKKGMEVVRGALEGVVEICV